MKTTEEWYKTLDVRFKDKAIQNIKKPNATHMSLAGALSNGFDWKNSPEGYDFWAGVFKEIRYGIKFEESEINNTLTNPPSIKSTSEDSYGTSKAILPDKKLDSSPTTSNKPNLLDNFKSQEKEKTIVQEISPVSETVESELVEEEDFFDFKTETIEKKK